MDGISPLNNDRRPSRPFFLPYSKSITNQMEGRMVMTKGGCREEEDGMENARVKSQNLIKIHT